MIHKLKDVGGQSPIEAAQLGCKVYHGPYIYNFKEIYNILNENGISEKIEDSKHLADKVLKDLVAFNNNKGVFQL